MRHKLNQLTNVAALTSGPALPRTFTISPAVSGKTTWDLDSDGPCTLVASNSPYTFTPDIGFSGQFELWGSGGGSGGIGAVTATTGGNGQAPNTSLTTNVGSNPTAQAGLGSSGATTNGAGAGKAGGAALNGDINTSGASGTAGTIAATCIGGNGGASPNGGATATGPSASAGVTLPGIVGNAPGGGAAGAVHGDATGALRRATGGAGAGAYCKKTYAVGNLNLAAHTINISLGGTAGTGDLAAGAAGANGSVIIT